VRVLITGGTGYIGTAMNERVPPGIQPVFAGHTRGQVRLDVTDEAAVSKCAEELRAEAIIHLAAVSRTDEAARDPGTAGDVNIAGSAAVARVAARTGARLVALSSDVVFSGTEPPYDERSAPDPINPYGRSKAAAERAVLEAHPAALIVRTSVLVGRDRADRYPFSSYVLERARAGLPIELFENERRNFFPVTRAAAAIWEFVQGPLSGILHVATRTSLSRLEFGVELLEGAGLDPALAFPTTGPLDRPSDLTLDVSRAAAHLAAGLPTMDDAVSETLADLPVA
jgi:dTDP-4-dehydrorhamnose reductase